MLIKQMEFLLVPVGNVEKSLLNMNVIVVGFCIAAGFVWGVWKLVKADWLILPFLYITGLGKDSSRSQPCTQGSTTLFYFWQLDTSLTRLSNSAKWVSASPESQLRGRPPSSVPFKLLVQPKVPVEPLKCVVIQVARVYNNKICYSKKQITINRIVIFGSKSEKLPERLALIWSTKNWKVQLQRCEQW